MRTLLYLTVLSLVLFSCNGEPTENAADSEPKDAGSVMVYTHRHYDVDKQLFEQFTKETGIAVEVVKDGADELMMRLENEGANSPADVLMTVDAGRLVRAQTAGLLQPIESEILAQNVPANLKDPEGYWFGQTIRARIIVYDKKKVAVEDLNTYQGLTDPRWQRSVLVRSSGNIYNQSLVASMIENIGEEETSAWIAGLVANFAREPKGNDRDQVKAIAAGIGTVAIVNTYYIGKLLNSDDAEEVKAGETVGIFFPNQEGVGTHINVSGAGVTKYSPNKENAVRLIEFLSGESAQAVFAEANYEYPVHPDVAPSELLASWGTFREDEVNLSALGKNNARAVELMDLGGWK